MSLIIVGASLNKKNKNKNKIKINKINTVFIKRKMYKNKVTKVKLLNIK